MGLSAQENTHSVQREERYSMRTSPRSSLVIAALALLTAVGPVGADVVPGDVITKANADKVKDLVSPGMFWCVQHGFR